MSQSWEPNPPQHPGDTSPEKSADSERRDRGTAAHQAPMGEVPAARDSPPTTVPQRSGKHHLVLRELVIVLGMTIVISFILKTFFVQAFYIPSGSMENTLLINDRIVVNKFVPAHSQLHRGDVIVFSDPGQWIELQGVDTSPAPVQVVRTGFAFIGLLPQRSDEHLIKRVIGLPGDRVECCDAQGRVKVNGVAIDEPYIFAGNRPSETAFSVAVPAGKLWVMGDHRKDSADSREQRARNHGGGFVPVENVVGQAVFRVWPLGSLGRVDSYPDVFAEVPGP